MQKNQSTMDWNKIYQNRKEIEEKILKSQEHYFILGARKIGKTSLLMFLEKEFWDLSIPAFYFSLEGDSFSFKIKRRIEKCFRRKKFSIPNSCSNEDDFFDFLEGLDSKLVQRIVFLVDEVEQITLIEKIEEGFINKLRYHIVISENIRFILTASPHFKQILPKSVCSTFLSAFSNDTLSIMTKNEISSLIDKLIPYTKKDRIEAILRYTHYQPYLVKKFLKELKKNGEINLPINDLAQKTYNRNHMDAIFQNYFDGLSPEDQKIITQIHRGMFIYENKFDTKLKELIEYGYLKLEEGKYKIPNWFFKEWLSRVDFPKDSEASKPDPSSTSSKNRVKRGLQEAFKNAWQEILKNIILSLLILIAVMSIFFLSGRGDKFLDWLLKQWDKLISF